eukprot:m.33093 g.33093  ORF g.33093 m.33093 type:complete len:706 (-) comp16755_c0_seq1:122-2239(-)
MPAFSGMAVLGRVTSRFGRSCLNQDHLTFATSSRMLSMLASTAHASQRRLNNTVDINSTLKRSFGVHGRVVCPAYAAASFQQRRSFSPRSLFGKGNDKDDEFTNPDVLHRLLEAAEDRPDDPVAQQKVLEIMALEKPIQAVKRYESGRYAINDSCTKSYIKALVYSNRLNQANLHKILPEVGAGHSSSWAAPTSQGGFGSSQYGDKGADGEPFYVAIQEPSLKQSFWKLIRSIVIILLVLSAVNQIMDERGLGGKGPMSSEITPEVDGIPYTFDDVQGVDEAKEELEEVVRFLKSPEDFTRLGGKLPKGVLLTGPPGTGKTLLAKAIAGEAGVPFFYCSGSEFDEMFVGVGARRVRDLFSAAKKKSPCIIFMDEIDAVGGKRSAKDQQFVKMTLNQLLVELDGFGETDQVIVIAATNFPEMLDPALVRPGRFDTHITVNLPDVRGREAILKLHAKDVPLAAGTDLINIARGTPGFSGAELANVINQAALKASLDHLDAVDIKTLEWAKDKIMMGSERKSAVIKPHDLKVTAYHEGGHALCALYTEGATPVYKATIMPRGNALGMVQQLPEEDVVSVTKKELEARLVVCMGGRAAEERIYGKENTTSGASNDLEQATRIARAMVTKYAFSDKIGPVSLDKEDHKGALGELIDSEVKRLCQDALNKAHSLLNAHDQEHHRLAEALLEHETLNADEIKAVVKGEKIRI